MVFVRPICNCPDATQNQNKNLFASSQTLTFDRNWNSRIGGQGQTILFPGIRDRGGYCIHELAVLNIRGEIDAAFPQGIPYQPKIDRLTNRRKAKQSLDSDFLYISDIPEVD
jgi:hypothetical protein